MRRRNPAGWVGLSVLILAAFSFFAGCGLRFVFSELRHGDRAATGPVSSSYPKLASASPRVPNTDLRPATLYMNVLHKLQLYYVEPLPSNTALSYGSIEAMLNKLGDPNTRLMSPTEVETIQDEEQGEFRGLGAVLTIRRYDNTTNEVASDELGDEPKKPAASNLNPVAGTKAVPTPKVRIITVVSTFPGSPAEKAGLQPGDRITHIDGHWIAPMHVSYRLLTQLTDPIGPEDGPPIQPDDAPIIQRSANTLEKAHQEQEETSKKWKGATDLASALSGLAGEQTGEHELTVERGTPAKTIKVNVTLGGGHADVFASKKLNGDTGYVHVLALEGGVERQVGDALAEFQRAGVKNLVVDLRHCAGGSIETAQALAGMIMGDGKFAVLKERDADRNVTDQPLMIHGASPRLKPARLSVLVDGGTAGSAEILAAALRDNLGAKLVGHTTFGDGTEQELIRLENGAGISITRARMLTSKGLDYDGKGLTPDVATAGDGDPVDAAVKALSAVHRPNGHA